MEKQKILYQQARLHARGAAEMVLQMISASKGNGGLIVSAPVNYAAYLLSYPRRCYTSEQVGTQHVQGNLKEMIL